MSPASIGINMSIRSLCASEDSREMSISISFLLMFMLMFSDGIVVISNGVADSLIVLWLC